MITHERRKTAGSTLLVSVINTCVDVMNIHTCSEMDQGHLHKFHSAQVYRGSELWVYRDLTLLFNLFNICTSLVLLPTAHHEMNPNAGCVMCLCRRCTGVIASCQWCFISRAVSACTTTCTKCGKRVQHGIVPDLKTGTKTLKKLVYPVSDSFPLKSDEDNSPEVSPASFSRAQSDMTNPCLAYSVWNTGHSVYNRNKSLLGVSTLSQSVDTHIYDYSAGKTAPAFQNFIPLTQRALI